MTARIIRKRLGCPEFTYNGRNWAGMSVFTAMIAGHLFTFRTNRRGRDAVRSAREYFTRMQKENP